MYIWPCCNTPVLTDSVSQSFSEITSTGLCNFSWLVVWIKGLARFYRKGYLNYLSTPDYQYWLAGFTPELDPNLKPQPISMSKPTLGAHKEQKKKIRELNLRILPRRNPLVDEPAWKHGSWCITPRGNKLKMVKLSKVMNETYIKHVWFLLNEKILL